jgi:hypothetical protein
MDLFSLCYRLLCAGVDGDGGGELAAPVPRHGPHWKPAGGALLRRLRLLHESHQVNLPPLL